MSLSGNIKRLRLGKNLTQEQLAAALGVSAQAVSKWETSETYPDGALLVPLARVLEVSLDELFDNDSAYMGDVSRKIARLICRTDDSERFNLARDICWQIERGLFNFRMEIENNYDPEDIKRQKNSSYILNDNGFTLVSNGKEPFFSVFPQPVDGYGYFLESREELQKIFAALSHEDTISVLSHLYRMTENYVFEVAVLARDCGISEEAASAALEDLLLLEVISRKDIVINGEPRVLYCSHPSHKLLAVFLMAKEIGYNGSYCFQSDCRNTPFFKK